MTDLPSGTVTFLFTDIEGSTRLWEQQPQAMQMALARHDTLLRTAIETHGGNVFKTMGDQFCAAFATASEALAAAVDAQRAVSAEAWREVGSVGVRMALNTGAVEQRSGDYFGAPLNRLARLLAAGHGGQILLSQATCDRVREALPRAAALRDLGAHRLKDLQQPEHVFQLLSPDLPADFPPLRSLEAFAHNLPAQLTSFIGREAVMAQVKQFLGTTRLLTLTGGGGCGKTRLALQVAADLLEEHADGVWLVELAPLADPALVPQTVASALGVREESGRAWTETLVEYLQGKQVLLILDNCEHLLAASAQLADALLRSCPRLRLLASSREGLGIGGEQTYRVPSLSLPVESGKLRVESPARTGPSELSTLNSQLSTLLQSEAVQLFADRARLSQASFAVTPETAAAVAQVCQRLDGIPLAIELAAARVRALPVEQIVARLDDRFRLLTGGSRTALPRQQTLRALIDWSCDLLSEAERALLRHLSVFAGGWTLEAAEAVCGAVESGQWLVDSSGKGNDTDQDVVTGVGPTTRHYPLATDVLDRLTSLVDKSLVVYDEQAGAGRYRLLETVRQYARDRLLEAGNGAAVRGRHRDFFLALAEAAAPELRGADQLRWLDRLDGEHGNLRQALSECLKAVDGGWWLVDSPAEAGSETDRPMSEPSTIHHPLSTASEAALRLGGALFLFWRMRGHYTEGLAWLEAALARAPAPGPPSRARARALLGAGHLGFYQQEDYAPVVARLAESAALWREIGDQRELAYTLAFVGGSAEYSARIPILEESVALAREVGDGWVLATALLQLAQNLWRFLGDLDRAETLARESAALFRQAGDRWAVAGPLRLLGWVAEGRGDSRTAIAMHEEALALLREVGDPWRISHQLCVLARCALAGGNVERAECLSQEGLAFRRKTGSRLAIIESLHDLARIAGGETEKAWALFEEAEALGRELGDNGQMSNIYMCQGHLLLEGGDYSAAHSRYEEGLALRRQTGDPNSLARALVEVGHAAWLQGEAGVTKSHAVEALRLFQTREDPYGLLAALESVAAAALAQGRKDHAARLMGAVEARREACLSLPEWWRRPREQIAEAVRAASLEQEFAATWAEGWALSLQDAIDYALHEAGDA